MTPMGPRLRAIAIPHADVLRQSHPLAPLDIRITRHTNVGWGHSYVSHIHPSVAHTNPSLRDIPPSLCVIVNTLPGVGALKDAFGDHALKLGTDGGRGGAARDQYAQFHI